MHWPFSAIWVAWKKLLLLFHLMWNLCRKYNSWILYCNLWNIYFQNSFWVISKKKLASTSRWDNKSLLNSPSYIMHWSSNHKHLKTLIKVSNFWINSWILRSINFVSNILVVLYDISHKIVTTICCFLFVQ